MLSLEIRRKVWDKLAEMIDIEEVYGEIDDIVDLDSPSEDRDEEYDKLHDEVAKFISDAGKRLIEAIGPLKASEE